MGRLAVHRQIACSPFRFISSHAMVIHYPSHCSTSFFFFFFWHGFVNGPPTSGGKQTCDNLEAVDGNHVPLVRLSSSLGGYSTRLSWVKIRDNVEINISDIFSHV